MSRIKSGPKKDNAPSLNIPVVLTSFVGRKRESSEIVRLLTSSRLLTLTGAAGCGKTRLALHVAQEMSHLYQDGIYWVELAQLNEARLVPQAVAKVFHMVEGPRRSVVDRLLETLDNKQLLLILDNCEHVLNGCVRLINALLKATEITILVTSREPLGVIGERLYPVPPMALPLASHSIGDMDQFDSIQLFVERARAIVPHFTLTPENAEAVTQICHHLDGLPLAIELASGRVKLLSVEQIAARLKSQFDLLDVAAPMTSGPHRTLRAAIDWSFNLLPELEQKMLVRLSVFAGGCSLVTAEAVCSGDGIEREQILELLSLLVTKSLVVAQTFQLGEARYSMLETIREYAHEQLIVSGDWSATCDRHLQCFLQLAEETAPKLIERYQQIWLDWLEVEHTNFRAALSWSLKTSRIEEGLRLAIALYEFWRRRGYVQQGLDWYEQLLAQADENISLVVQAKAFTGAANLAMLSGNTSATIDYARKAGALGQASGDQQQSNIGVALMSLANMANSVRTAGDYQTAFKMGETAVQLLRKSGEVYLLGLVLIMHAGTAMALGRYDAVHSLLNEALKLSRQAGDSYRIALILNFLGDLARCEEDFAGAKPHYENSITLFRELDAKWDLASVLQNLGHTCLHLGDVTRGHALFVESLSMQQTQQNIPGMAECLIGFAAIAIVQGLPAAGVRLLSAAIALGGKRQGNVWAATRLEYERCLALAQAKLTEMEFQAEQAAGNALSLEQAIEYARHLPLQAASKLENTPDQLTTREREIAILIAQGKSNGEIADELVLSKRTIEKHIANILSKLGVTSRTQIVRWIIQSGLLKFTE